MTKNEFDSAMGNVKILKEASEHILRFYPVMLRPREKKDDVKKEDDMDDSVTGGEKEQSAQIWIIRFSDKRGGQQAADALEALSVDRTLQDMMMAETRPDRAPRGSMARMLQESLVKGTVGKKEEE